MNALQSKQRLCDVHVCIFRMLFPYSVTNIVINLKGFS